MPDLNKKNIHFVLSLLTSMMLSISIAIVIHIKQNNEFYPFAVGIISFVIYLITYLTIIKFYGSAKWIIHYYSLVILVFVLVASFLISTPKDLYNHPAMRKAPAQIITYLEQWNYSSSALRILQTLLALIAIFTSLFVALQINKVKPNLIKWIAFISALTIGLLTSFNFGERANRYRNAWRVLNKAVMEYELNQVSEMQVLIDKYYEAEKIIGDVEVTIK